MMNVKEIYADAIPSQGGRQIGKYLRRFARMVPKGCAAVELGAWLGSGTAQISLGLLRSGFNCPLFCYDNFKALKTEVEKAALFGVELVENQNTLPLVRKYLRPIYKRIHFIKGNVADIKYNGPPIGLYVDDVSKRIETFLPVITELEPHFIDGAMIVLMDYFFFEKNGNLFHKAQYNWMQENLDRFEFLFRPNPVGSPAFFKYHRRGDGK